MKNFRKIKNIFRFTIFSTLISTIFVMGCLWIYTSYGNFYEESENLRTEYISTQKSLIKNEIENIVENIEFRKLKTEVKVKERVKERTYDAYKIAINIYNENKNSKSKSEMQRMVVNTLNKINYNGGRGYYFGGNLEDGVLLFTNSVQFLGENVLKYKDSEDRYVFKDMMEIVKSKDEGFYEYMWERPGNIGKGHRKISFVKRVEPLNLLIGTGEYYVDFQHEMQQEILDEISRVSFGKKRRIFVGNFNGLDLMSKDRVQCYLFWKNWWELEDSNGIKIIQDFRKAAEKKDGDFVNYIWGSSINRQPVSRIAFVKGVQDWKWMIGAEIYLHDVETIITTNKVALKNRIAKNIIKIMSAIFCLSVLAILLEIYVTKKTKDIIELREG